MRWLALTVVLSLFVTGCTTQTDDNPAAVPSRSTTAQATSSQPASPPIRPSPDIIDPTNPAPSGTMNVVFIDIGQGAAVIIQLPDAVILNDVGRNSQASADAIKAALQVLGVAEIDAMIITNADADHAGGCDDIYAAYPVKALYHPGAPKDTITWSECLAAAQAEGTPVYTDADISPGDHLAISGMATVKVLNVAQGAENVNSGSIAIRVDYSEQSWIFPGDIECDEEDEIIARGYDLDVDFLQAAHHGSAGSNCASWLAATTPSQVFIPVGATNQYGHPSPAAMDRIAGTGAQVFRTDHHGRITWDSDGTTFSVTTEKQPAAATSSTSTTSSPATSTPTTSPPGSGTTVRITDIYYAPPSGAPLTEYVALENQGTSAAAMDAWTVKDEVGATYSFPSGFTLAAGATVKVYTGSGSDTASELYWGRGQAVWNNSGGDTAYLLDAAGVLVDEWSYN